MSQDVGISRATQGETKPAKISINPRWREEGREEAGPDPGVKVGHSRGRGDLQGEYSLWGAPRFRHVEAGCLLHAKIMQGLWRDDPPEWDSARVGLRAGAGQVSLPFGCVCFTGSIGIHLVLTDFFYLKATVFMVLPLNETSSTNLLGSLKTPPSPGCPPCLRCPLICPQSGRSSSPESWDFVQVTWRSAVLLVTSPTPTPSRVWGGETCSTRSQQPTYGMGLFTSLSLFTEPPAWSFLQDLGPN